jgi:pilus assembly protein CpaB
MSRRRRAILLGGLALVLGVLAASDVARRESALARSIGPVVEVVVARTALPAGTHLTTDRLALRAVPRRYAPSGAFADPAALGGLRAAIAVPAGADVVAGMVDDVDRAQTPGAPVRPGERAADLVATGSLPLITPGSHVDVIVTRGGDGSPGNARLALEDVEVLAAAAADGAHDDSGEPKVAVSLRVTVRQAVYLAAAQSFARDIRLLPRAAGDDRQGAAGTSVGAGL